MSRARILSVSLGFWAVAVAAAGCGSKAPLRDCAVPLAKTEKQLAQLKKELAGLRRQDAKLLGAFRALNAQLKKIDAKYPSNVLPPAVYKRYKRIEAKTDAAYKRYSTAIDRTNAVIVRHNAVVRRVNSLRRCKPGG